MSNARQITNAPVDDLKRVNFLLPVRILEFLFEEKKRRRRIKGGGSIGVIITEAIDHWRNDPPWSAAPEKPAAARQHRRR